MFTFITAFFALSLSASALASPPKMQPSELPEDLKEWVEWATAGEEGHNCPQLDGLPNCIWPSKLQISADASGASLEMSVYANIESDLLLPGGDGQWPQSVRVDGAPAVVSGSGLSPRTRLKSGNHTVTARIKWATMPTTIKIPKQTGTIQLKVNGKRIPWPHRDSSGSIRLGMGDQSSKDDETITIEASRRIDDGVPVVVTTVLDVSASGSAREIDLGQVLNPETKPVSISANLPVRFTEDSSLVLQVRPGEYTVTIKAISQGAVSTLTPPDLSEPWPPTEYWVIDRDDKVRSFEISGAPGVDPNRTTLPAHWRTLPAFAVSKTDSLHFNDLRRGEPMPAANNISLTRKIWLDSKGQGYSVNDTFTGTMHQGWRLDTIAPFEIGRVSTDSFDQVISLAKDGKAGVELRDKNITVSADSRVNEPARHFSATGWNTDVHRLKTDLYLPPGWQLFTAFGVDTVSGSVLGDWTLFDLFFVLIVSLSIGKLFGRKWGVVALVGLALAQHQAGAPEWSIAFLVLASAIGRVIEKFYNESDGGRNYAVIAAKSFNFLMLFIVIIVLTPFVVGQVQSALFPVLDTHDVSQSAALYDNMDSEFRDRTFLEEDSPNPDASEGSRSRARKEEGKVGRTKKGKESIKQQASANIKSKDRYLSLQVDPSAIVQTGPGLPNWTWRKVDLDWSGPVTSSQMVRLLLFGPLINLLLALIRVIALVAIVLRLSDLDLKKMGVASLWMILPLGLCLTPTVSMAQAPSPDILKELQNRLLALPECSPSCSTTTLVNIKEVNDQLTISATVHAEAMVAWALMGPTGSWTPSAVNIDGKPAAMRRNNSGYLQVRVPEGIHKIEATGPLPSQAALTLQFSEQPKKVTFSGRSWAVEGLKADGTAEKALQLVRTIESGKDASLTNSIDNLSPWVEVRRKIDFGIPWQIETEVIRSGPVSTPLSMKVPLISGEQVTTSGIQVSEGTATVVFERDSRRVNWHSKLSESDVVTLRATDSLPFTERWEILCSPVFSCEFEGIDPIQHSDGSGWAPVFLPWAGEQIDVTITRPESMTGQTTTIDSVKYTVTPGKRQLEATLALSIRSSQGGRKLIKLPDGVSLQKITVDGSERPIQIGDDGMLPLPLSPGKTLSTIKWQQPQTAQFIGTVPAVDLGSDAVNIEVVVHPMPDRWLMLLSGPDWGPIPLFWTYLVLVLAVAPLLARLKWTPLKWWHWALLGMGMAQVPVIVPMFIVIWLVAIGIRKVHYSSNPELFNATQIALAGLTFLAVIALYISIHTGLLVQPDMQVMGNGSNNSTLTWYLDRSDGALPQPTIVSSPLWVWRIIMLAWALWLASAIVKRAPWAWAAFTTGGFYKVPSLLQKGKAPIVPAEDDDPTEVVPE